MGKNTYRIPGLMPVYFKIKSWQDLISEFGIEGENIMCKGVYNLEIDHLMPNDRIIECYDRNRLYSPKNKSYMWIPDENSMCYFIPDNIIEKELTRREFIKHKLGIEIKK